MGDTFARILGSGGHILYSGFRAPPLSVICFLAGLGSTDPAFAVVQPCSRCSPVTSQIPGLPSLNVKPIVDQSGCAVASNPGIYQHRLMSQQPSNLSDGSACQAGPARKNLGEVEEKVSCWKEERGARKGSGVRGGNALACGS